MQLKDRQPNKRQHLTSVRMLEFGQEPYLKGSSLQWLTLFQENKIHFAKENYTERHQKELAGIIINY